MENLFQHIIKTQAFVENTVTLKLLRARNLALIATFIYKEFKADSNIAVPYRLLVQHLADLLEETEYSDKDDELQSNKLLLDYDERAKIYIDRWIEAHFLRNMVDEQSKEPHVFLSKHTEKLFQVFELLREREFVGTESKFKDVFHKLRDIIENANPDKEKKLQELEKRKQAIEEEIRKIKIDGYVHTYEDYQVKSRFEEVNRMANELIGDFKEVEDNFKDITRRIYEKQQQHDLTKGKLLVETFDALQELRSTYQGRSFYAFWQFMIDDASQQEFQQLTKEVYQIMESRGIDIPSKSLRRLKTLLHMAARKVLDKNGLLADKLSREIVAREQPEHLKTQELISSIRQLAIKRLDSIFLKETYLQIEDIPYIFLPMERKLGEKNRQNEFASVPDKAVLNLNDLDGLEKIYSANLVDKKVLLANIEALLEHKMQVSLKEVIDEKGMSKGLPELLAYITLVNHSAKFYINDQAHELIAFDTVNHKYLEVPQIIFTR